MNTRPTTTATKSASGRSSFRPPPVAHSMREIAAPNYARGWASTRVPTPAVAFVVHGDGGTDEPVAIPCSRRRWLTLFCSASGRPGTYPDRTHTSKRRRPNEHQPPTSGNLLFCWTNETPRLEIRSALQIACWRAVCLALAALTKPGIEMRDGSERQAILPLCMATISSQSAAESKLGRRSWQCASDCVDAKHGVCPHHGVGFVVLDYPVATVSTVSKGALRRGLIRVRIADPYRMER